MTATLTISQGEREALHWLLCRRLFILGQDPPELARREGVTLTKLAAEFGEDLRLMHDLGWEPERRDASVALTMPRRKAALRDAIDAGILDVLGPVASPDEFARRLIAIGIVDRSDERFRQEPTKRWSERESGCARLRRFQA